MKYSIKLDDHTKAGEIINRLMFFSDLYVTIRRTSNRVHIDFIVRNVSSMSDQSVVTEVLSSMEKEFDTLILPKVDSSDEAWGTLTEVLP